VAESHTLIVEVLYHGLTQLDFTGPHTIFSRIPGAEVIVASEPGGPIESDDRLTFAGTKCKYLDFRNRREADNSGTRLRDT